MATEQTRTHYEAMAAEAAAQTQRVDVLAVMQLGADMLDTGEFEIDRETGRELLVARAAVAELIEAARERQVPYTTDRNSDAARKRLDAALARVSGGAK